MVDQGEDKFSEADDITEIEYYVVEEWIVANAERDEVITKAHGKYENPPKLQLSAYHASGDLRIAGFRVSASDVYDYLHTKIGSFTPSELREACGSYITKSELNLEPVLNEYDRGMLSSGDEIGTSTCNSRTRRWRGPIRSPSSGDSAARRSSWRMTTW